MISPNAAYSPTRYRHFSDATPGTAVFMTLDNSTPTSNSTPYHPPPVCFDHASTSGRGVKPGLVNSGVQRHIPEQLAIGSGIGLRGAYWSNTTAAALSGSGVQCFAIAVALMPW